MSFIQPQILSGDMRIMAFIVAMTVMISPPAYATDAIERSVTGDWRFTAALDGADIVALDENEAHQLLGRIFSISRERIKFGNHVCGRTEFDATKVEPKRHLREAFHASAKKLKLPNPVTVVDLSCTSVFIKSQNRLVIFWQGWFFDATRIKN